MLSEKAYLKKCIFLDDEKILELKLAWPLQLAWRKNSDIISMPSDNSVQVGPHSDKSGARIQIEVLWEGMSMGTNVVQNSRFGKDIIEENLKLLQSESSYMVNQSIN